uniref:Brix domain-containing protein n=1 Tax=Caenorhabditis japonica TaxID=281687 RepID=A0A8R1E574_CAEJA
MIRRENRLRREYIFRKSLEEKQKTLEEKREKIRDALENNAKIDYNLRNDAVELAKGSEWGGQSSEVDNEYRWAGAQDPKIVITTSRDPSSRLKMFSKEMKLIFPNSQRINRGHYDVKQVVQACKAQDSTDLIILTETRGNPDGMIVCHLPFGPTAFFSLHNVVMRHDIPNCGTMSEQYPHLIVDNLNSKLGLRFATILKHLYPVPSPDSKRVITFSNAEDYISFRHHVFKTEADGEIELTEVGPRFEMKPYQIKLGTLENLAAAEDEWVLRSYTNTARKRNFLSIATDE